MVHVESINLLKTIKSLDEPEIALWLFCCMYRNPDSTMRYFARQNCTSLMDNGKSYDHLVNTLEILISSGHVDSQKKDDEDVYDLKPHLIVQMSCLMNDIKNHIESIPEEIRNMTSCGIVLSESEIDDTFYAFKNLNMLHKIAKIGVILQFLFMIFLMIMFFQ